MGQAAATFLGKSIVIGKDTRLSGDMLESAVAAGIMSAGGTALVADVIPTPGVAFLIKEPRMASDVEEYLKNLPDGTTVEDAQAVEALERYLKTL